MALTDESTNGMVMPVAPMYGGGYGGNGSGNRGTKNGFVQIGK